MPTTTELASLKLESSGLTLKDAKQLQITVVEPIQLKKMHESFGARPAIRFNYLDPASGGPLSSHPKWPPFYRIRFLDKPDGFNEQAKIKSPKYLQEPGSGLCAYYPMNHAWPATLQDPEVPLLITEGELKAAKACKEGFPCIGLGGVYSFRSADAGEAFIPSLRLVNWVKRAVYIVFDSDFRTNKNVCHALMELAEQLELQGALPYMIPLPDPEDGSKIGLDDYLLTTTAEDFRNYVNDQAKPLSLARSLWRQNQKILYVRNPGLIVNQLNNHKQTPSDFKSHGASEKVYVDRKLRLDGTYQLEMTSIAQPWLEWPMRATADQFTYAPGKPKYIEGPPSMWNEWPGWGCEPRPSTKADVQPFLDLVDHLFTGATTEAKRWFMQWLAFPLKYPGTKLFTSVAIHGVEQGTGKSQIGYTMGKIYGQNFIEIKQAELHSSFNGWAANKQFILGDDITGSDKREIADQLKSMITQKELRVNEKYLKPYTLPDCVNYMLNSNQPDAFFMEDSDRRIFVHEVVVPPLSDGFYVEFDMWKESGGPAYLFDYLLKLDTDDFNPAARAMPTAAKARMLETTRSDVGSWVRRLLEHPDLVLKLGGASVEGDLFTNKELLNFYDGPENSRLTANGLGRELSRAGARQVHEGRTVVAAGTTDRYYIVRNQARWLKANLVEVQRHLEKTKKKLCK